MALVISNGNAIQVMRLALTIDKEIEDELEKSFINWLNDARIIKISNDLLLTPNEENSRRWVGEWYVKSESITKYLANGSTVKGLDNMYANEIEAGRIAKVANLIVTSRDLKSIEFKEYTTPEGKSIFAVLVEVTNIFNNGGFTSTISGVAIRRKNKDKWGFLIVDAYKNDLVQRAKIVEAFPNELPQDVINEAFGIEMSNQSMKLHTTWVGIKLR